MGHRSQTIKLIGLVHQLCDQLHRPVSSRDLLYFFRNDPTVRPLLFQRPGQLLFKLSRQKKRFGVGIHHVGIISNLAFYSPTSGRHWIEAFEAHRDLYQLGEQCHLRMPEHTLCLLGTRFDAFARNALAGFILEFEPVYERQRKTNSEIVTDFSGLLAMAKQHAAESFVLTPPEKLITRAAAGRILAEEYARRLQIDSPVTMSTGRHLVHLKWPQASFLGEATQLFWEEQVYAYCASRWPVNAAEQKLGRGISLAMRYGREPSRLCV
jgi:hypothetical protein